MNLAKVLVFLKEYNVAIPHKVAAEIFKKQVSGRNAMNFEDFKPYLEHLYAKLFDLQRESLKRKLLSINYVISKSTEGDDAYKILVE